MISSIKNFVGSRGGFSKEPLAAGGKTLDKHKKMGHY